MKKTILSVIMGAIKLGENALIKTIPTTGWEEVIIAIRIGAANLRNIAEALFDEDPKNKEQILEILQGSAQKDVPNLVRQLFTRTQKIKDPSLKSFVNLLANPTINTLLIMTDDDKNDEAQLKKLFQDTINDKTVQNELLIGVLKPILVSKIKDEFLLNFVLGVLDELIKENN